MNEISKLYVVTVNIANEKYYLSSLSGTISKCICDSLIFPNENVACFYATRMENIYQDDKYYGKTMLSVLFRYIIYEYRMVIVCYYDFTAYEKCC